MVYSFPKNVDAKDFNKIDNRIVGNRYRIEHPRLPYPENINLIDKKYSENRKKKYKDVRELLLAYLSTKNPDLLLEIKQLADAKNNGSQFNMLNELSLAYDWIYNDLDIKTRQKFLERIVKYTEGAVEYYKKHRMSPYNDVGYVRIGYSLFVGAIVCYPDHPQSEKLIKFAQKILFDVYLPVWKQIIGNGGGWHEGIEYLHVGVGRVIVPSLNTWGFATGENLFDKYSWLENLIYYPIYTTRPDHTPIRVGDINDASLWAFHDMSALTAIYKNPYGVWWLTHGRGYKTSDDWYDSVWPWFSEKAVKLPMDEITNLPLHHHFESLGLVTMRSGWNEEDVFASFKVGDNYWSHQHFDSGSFTIYRRGALAIDSGSYTAGYDSDHHMKYQMQTIAHNCITVTDPIDRDRGSKWLLPNDGGQRRVGSGGYNNSPDTISDWMNHIDDYEMGNIISTSMNKDFVHVIGDVTPAYTNKRTGSGDYRSRTPRVKKWLRDFLYIRPEIFVVFDRVLSFKATYQKKWLLHSIDEPVVDYNKIIINRTEQVKNNRSWHWSLKNASEKKKKFYQYKGKLFLYPLLPAKHLVEKIGGFGKEFLVDGVNYNDGRKGPISADPNKGPQEPGAWRIEISPENPEEYDTFLNVLIPLDAEEKNSYKVVLNSVISGKIITTYINKFEKDYYVSFNSEVEHQIDSSLIIYSLHKENKNSEHYLFGFPPGSCYKIMLNNTEQTISLKKTTEKIDNTIICSDINGVIHFSL